MTTLRSRLRDDSRCAHDRLDRLVTGYDLRRTGPLARFLAGNHAALRALRVARGPFDGEAEALRDDLLPALSADLGTLGVSPGPGPEAQSFDDRAALYVLLGSRLGTQVLCRQWAEATDPRVRAASAYFDRPFGAQDWKRFTAWLDDQPAEGPAADRAVRDAARLFDHFETALRRQTQEVAHA